MSAKNKARGSLWERQLEEHLNAAGARARRLPRAGNKDIGDVSVSLKNDVTVVMEAKNVKVANMADFLRQADVEADNYEDKYGVPTIPVVVTKTRQKGPGEGRVVMTVDTFLDLLRMAKLID